MRLDRSGGRRLILREEPLTVVELRPRGWRLLESVRDGAELDRPPAPELQLLRRLAELSLVELRPVLEEWPGVCVVVPVRDRPRQLAACLDSLARLRYPREQLDVVVVDDGSDPPAAVPAGIRLLRLHRSVGPAGARNAGARQSRAELLAFLDSDCVADPGWLQELTTELADPAVAAAGGRVQPAGQRSWLERYEVARSPLDLGPNPAVVRPRTRVPYLVSANLAVRRAQFEVLGGFDERLRHGEDVDLSWRLCALGRRLVYQPRAAVRHEHRGSLGEFVRTRAAYAASEAALLRRHPRNGRFLGLSPGLAAVLLTPVGLVPLGAEIAVAARRLRREVGVPAGVAVPAVLRGHGATLYHGARQVSRYYALPAAGLALLARRRAAALAAVGAALVAPAVGDWLRLRPPLSLPAFVAAHVLDDAAYHAGSLLGCMRERTLRPLLVELRVLPSGQRS